VDQYFGRLDLAPLDLFVARFRVVERKAKFRVNPVALEGWIREESLRRDRCFWPAAFCELLDRVRGVRLRLSARQHKRFHKMGELGRDPERHIAAKGLPDEDDAIKSQDGDEVRGVQRPLIECPLLGSAPVGPAVSALVEEHDLILVSEATEEGPKSAVVRARPTVDRDDRRGHGVVIAGRTQRGSHDVHEQTGSVPKSGAHLLRTYAVVSRNLSVPDGCGAVHGPHRRTGPAPVQELAPDNQVSPPSKRLSSASRSRPFAVRPAGCWRIASALPSRARRLVTQDLIRKPMSRVGETRRVTRPGRRSDQRKEEVSPEDVVLGFELLGLDYVRLQEVRGDRHGDGVVHYHRDLPRVPEVKRPAASLNRSDPRRLEILPNYADFVGDGERERGER
jgi:hypothetical protein